jgi:Dyp-type peroxidase family
VSPRVDPHDVQGNVLRGYGRFGFPRSRYVFFRIEDAAGGRRFVRQLLGVLTSGAPWSGPGSAGAARPRATTNAAFTYAGLAALGVPEASLRGFPGDFAMGMRARASLLGDDGPSAPEHWDPIWREREPVHLCVSIYAASPTDLEQRHDELLFMAQASGGVRALGGHRGDAGELCDHQDACALYENGRPTAKEHFGYVDGLSDPYFEGSLSNPESVLGGGKRTGAAVDTPEGWAPLATGEFLLGYPDEARECARAPEPQLLARNGTFMVYRKLHQNVASFARTLETLGKGHGGPEWVAAKFAGRWRGGAPLANFATQDSAEAFAAQLAASPSGSPAYRALRRQLLGFDFASDAQGARCPLGSHIRRSNPRAALAHGSEAAFDTPGALVDRRRMLRRGLPYGAAGTPPRDDGNHGLIFVALGAAIERQFEFVQQQWLNYGNDLQLSSEKDPLLGNHGRDVAGQGQGKFIVQGDAAQGRPPLFCGQLPRFVETRGGDYFFVPSLTALRMLAAGSIDVI